MKMTVPTATVFISSACIMILELVAGRLIARHLGSSLYTWTSVIGVVLAGITIGNYIGGRIADRFPARKTLAVLFGVASAACVAIVVLNNIVGEWIWLWQLSWALRVFSHVAIVFLLPSTLLGMISPVVAKMALDLGFATGRTVGDIYAWGAAGSIAGTFLAGFYLIVAIGTIAIVWLVGGVLLLMGILYSVRLWALYAWALIFISLAIIANSSIAWAQGAGSSIALRADPDPDIVYEDETAYFYVAVRRVSQSPEKRAFMQDKLMHSQMEMGNIRNLLYSYAKIHAAVTDLNSGDKETLNTLTIGGGGYVFPRYLEDVWPGSRVDVVEIDPGVTEGAMAGLGLSRDTSINSIHMDARNYVKQLLEKEKRDEILEKYDFIYEDALNDYSVPFQLTTKEFNDQIAHMLTDDGVYMIEVIDIFDSGLFVGALLNTLEKTFPYVYIIAQLHPYSTRNIFALIASKQELKLGGIQEHEQVKDIRLWILNEAEMQSLREKADVVLTDDYAPVENLLAPVVRQNGRELLALKCMEQAEEFKISGQLGRAKVKYLRAAELYPSTSIKAYNEIGLIEVAQGNLQQAAKAFQRVIDDHYNAESSQNIIGSVHLNMAILLKQVGMNTESQQHFARAIEQFRMQLDEDPKSALTWNRLGDTYAMTGDFKSAAAAFSKALELDPADPANYDNLAKALQYCGDLDAAINVSKAQLSLLRRGSDKKACTLLQQYIDSLERDRAEQQKK